MPNLALITAQAVAGNSGVLVMARIRGSGGALITPASFSTVAIVVSDLTLYNQGAAGYQQGTFAPSPASCIFNALVQNDPSWSKDSLLYPGPDAQQFGASQAWGYNFAYLVPAAMFVNSGHRFQVDAVLTPVSGQPFRVPWQFGTQQVFG